MFRNFCILDFLKPDPNSKNSTVDGNLGDWYKHEEIYLCVEQNQKAGIIKKLSPFAKFKKLITYNQKF